MICGGNFWGGGCRRFLLGRSRLSTVCRVAEKEVLGVRITRGSCRVVPIEVALWLVHSGVCVPCILGRQACLHCCHG